jgi:hypothetical protein
MSEINQDKFNFGGHVTHIEDAENAQTPVDGIKTLTDEELETAGLIRTSAFVRSKRSKNALRVEKHKKLKEESGIKQLNIEVPDEHREMIKALTKALKDGQSIAAALKLLLPPPKTPNSINPSEKAADSVLTEEQVNYAALGKKVMLIQQSGGIKSILLKIIL